MRRTRTAAAGSLCLALMLAGGLSLATHDKGNVDELRFGINLDAQGQVAVESASDHFHAGTPIHVSMKVEEAPKGTPLVLSILDRETEELVWSKKRRVPGGHSTMNFAIANLRPGKYRAKVKLGTDWVAEHEFIVE